MKTPEQFAEQLKTAAIEDWADLIEQRDKEIVNFELEPAGEMFSSGGTWQNPNRIMKLNFSTRFFALLLAAFGLVSCASASLPQPYRNIVWETNVVTKTVTLTNRVSVTNFLVQVKLLSVMPGAIVTWDSPTDPNVKNVRVYRGTNSGIYFQHWDVPPPATNLIVTNLAPHNVFTATTLDAWTNESGYAPEVNFP